MLDQLRERLHYLHYSLQTEKNYVYWVVRWFIHWHHLRHPKDMAGPEGEAFLSLLANERKVSPSTHRKALSALLFYTKKYWTWNCPGCRKLVDRGRRNISRSC